jgi:hypothetical protein
MARLARYTMKLFGSTAGSQEIAQFGSAAAAGFPGTPAAYSGSTITPTIVQTLSNYLEGWFGAVDGQFNPAIEDVNAIDWLYSYMLNYLMQLGIPEWDTSTTYYTGSIAQDGSGNVYVSLTNSNSGNALSSAANWQKISGTNTVQTKTASYVILTTDSLVRMNSASNTSATLPSAVTCPGAMFTIKNINTGTVTVATTSSQTIDGGLLYSLPEQYQFVRVQSNGTNWDIIGW